MLKREILFRGKRVDTYEWVYGFLYMESGKYYIIDDEGNKFKVDPETVGQFTGLYDREDNRIFEDDIVEYADPLTDGMTVTRSKVTYLEGYWYPLVDVEYGYNTIDEYHPEKFKVVGNIHDDNFMMK